MRKPLLPLLAALGLLWACHLENEPGGVYMDVEIASDWSGYDSVVVIVRDSLGNELGRESGKTAADFDRVLLRNYGGGKAEVEVRAYQGGRMVLQHVRHYDGSNPKPTAVDSLVHPGKEIPALDIPATLRIFLGGPSGTLAPAQPWPGPPLTWTSRKPGIASVSSGVVTARAAGKTTVVAALGSRDLDSAEVTVVEDAPVLDAGAQDEAVLLDQDHVFEVRITQEYGTVEYFAWDLDGDGVPEDSAKSIAPAQTLFLTPARRYAAPGNPVLNFFARDGEKNAGQAAKRIRVVASAPKVDSLSADTVISIGDEAVFAAVVSVSQGALQGVAWDFDGNGTFDSSASLAGVRARVTARHRYAGIAVHAVVIRVTDASGVSNVRSTKVTVVADPPAAEAGPDQDVPAGATVNLRGSAFDSLGRVAKREWNIGGQGFVPADSAGGYSFQAPASGEVVCVFRVTDDDGQSAQDSLRIKVLAAPPEPLLAALVVTSAEGQIGLNPDFSAGETLYVAIRTAASAEVKPTAVAGASVSVNGTPVAEGKTWALGARAIGAIDTAKVKVTAGGRSRTYHVILHREALSKPWVAYGRFGATAPPGQVLTDGAGNPSGEVRQSHLGNGEYDVTFQGFGSPANSPDGHPYGDGHLGHVQVSSVGDSARVCDVASWDAQGQDFKVKVKCHQEGTQKQSAFSVVAFWPGTSAAGAHGFAARELSLAEYVISPKISYSTAGQAIVAKRTQAGRYELRFPGLPGGGSGVGGVMVTTYHQDGASCRPTAWHPVTDEGLRINVDCWDIQGNARDAAFAAAAAWPIRLAGGSLLAHASIAGRTLPYVDELASHNPAGTIQVERVSTGTFTVRFLGLGEMGTPGGKGAALVAGRNGGKAICQASGWLAPSGTAHVEVGVRCHDWISPVDEEFNVWFVK